MKRKMMALCLVFSMLASCILPNSAYASETTVAEDTVNVITLGETKVGTISTAGEVLEYYFTTTSSDSYYTITASNLSINGYKFNAVLYDSFDNQVWSVSDVNVNKSSSYNGKLKQNETYRFTFSASDSYTGNFSILITEEVDDLPDTRAEAKTVALGETVYHSIDGGGDEDWFKFTTSNRYSYYEITSKNVSINGYNYNFRLYKYDEQRLINHTDIAMNKSKTTYYMLDPGTTYYIKCTASGNYTGNYSFTINELTDDTYNEKENAMSIKTNVTYTRKIEVSDDVDYFKFTTGANEDYTLTLNNIAISGYSLCAYIYSETDERMTSITDLKSGATKTAQVTLKRFTDYYMKVLVSSSVTGNYSFSIADSAITGTDTNMNPIVCDVSGVVNPVVQPETTIAETVVAGGTEDAPVAIEFNTTSYGAVETAGESYWYTFTTTANDSYYKLTVKNVSISGYNYDAYVYDANGSTVWKATSINKNKTSSTQLKLEPNSTYLVKCSASEKKLGKYSVTVVETMDDLGDTVDTAKEVALEENVVHRIDGVGDVDWFRFTTLSDDAYYKITATNLSIDGYRYCFYVYDEYDAEVTKFTDKNYGTSGTAYIKLNPNTTYYVKCKASDGYTGNYQFIINHILDDVPDTKETAMELKLNKKYDRNIDAPGDVDYFKYTVTEAGNYTFYSKNLSIDGYNENAILTNEYDEQLAKISDQNFNKEKSVTVALTAGTYYVKVNAGSSKTGTYRIYLLKENAVLEEEVVATYPLVSISLNKSTTKLVPTNTEQLTVTYNPYYTTDNKTVTWTSSNTSVATVSNGLITAKAKGTCTITATVNGKTASCMVTVISEDEKTVQDNLGLSDEGAKELTDFANKNNVSMDIILTTDTTITTQNSEDIAAASYNILSARATKTARNSITLKWNKVKGADGYIIYGNKCGLANKYKKITTLGKNKTTYTQKKLKKGTFYKYLVIAYKVIDNQKITIEAAKTIHAITTGGKYGNAKSVKVNKTKVSLKVNKTFTIKASEVRKDKTLKKHRKIAYESTNTAVATVNKNGKITAKGKGICYVYVYAQNGMFKKVKVTVK